MNSAVSGLVGGAVATVLGGKKLGIQRELPPKRVMEGLVPKGRTPDDPRTKAATAAAHMAFGMAGGVAYATGLKCAGMKRGPAQGMLYGLGIWLLSYEGWVPSLGLMPRADKDRPGRVATNVLAHLVYGAVLGACLGDQGDDHRLNQPRRSLLAR